MDCISVRGGLPLKGKVTISGAKNAALPLMVTSLLTKDPITLSNVPHLVDISTFCTLLSQHGVKIILDGSAKGGHLGKTFTLQAEEITSTTAPYEIVRKMRASIWVLGPLLARVGKAKVSLPGGCTIGTRPVDLHLQGLEAMGADIKLEDGYIHAFVEGRLKGVTHRFPSISVGATENLMMAATLATGTTVLENCALEPEIGDLAACLIKMGAKIEGIGTSTLIIEGVDELHGATHDIIPDRIEAGTYAIAAAITKGDLTLENARPGLMDNLLDCLKEAGCEVDQKPHALRIKMDKRVKSVDITTEPFPGYATDLQAQFMALMSVAEGTSHITETIFENRFMHVPELARMGADIQVNGSEAVVKGVEGLKGAPVMATDLRASVSLILAGLAAEGTTMLHRVYHLDRGYERIESKLVACGADIKRSYVEK